MSGELPRLHVVTADHIARLSDLAVRARAIAQAGPIALHARARLDGKAFVAFAQTLALAHVPLFVNDRADVARALDADGLHLPANGLPIDAARRLVGDRRVGRSVHSPDQARRAMDEGADYVFLGPVWPTASHPGRQPVGLDAVTKAHPARVVAIGGITAARVRPCMDAGAYGVAVLSAVWDADEPGSVVERMMVDLG